MKQSDYTDFSKMLRTCLAMWGDAPSAEVSAMWFRVLSDYELDAVQAAFNSHMRDPVGGKFSPKPAHLIEQIQRAAKDDGRPGPEEAWAISLAARDEAETVVWTQECAQAWGACKPVMELGDEVGARMAFREAYTRMVTAARARNEPADWSVSEGFDKDLRRIAVSTAVEAGRIAPGRFVALESVSATALLGGTQTSGIPAEIRAKLAALSAQFTAPPTGVSDAEADRLRMAKLKREQADKVANYRP